MGSVAGRSRNHCSYKALRPHSHSNLQIAPVDRQCTDPVGNYHRYGYTACRADPQSPSSRRTRTSSETQYGSSLHSRTRAHTARRLSSPALSRSSQVIMSAATCQSPVDPTEEVPPLSEVRRFHITHCAEQFDF